MNFTKLHRNIFALAAIASSWSMGANADSILYWHWEGGGGSPCGPFCTSVTSGHIVIDGWRPDPFDSGSFPNRFPTRGGGGGVKMLNSKAGKISGHEGYSGCTVPQNQPGVTGFLQGQNTWKVYIDSSVSDRLQDAFEKNIDAINADQQMRGRNFSVELVSWRILADTIISTPTWYRPLSDDESLSMSKSSSTRSGVLKSSFVTVTTDKLSPLGASRLAATALAVASGLDISNGDFSFPNITQPGNSLQIIDPCTLAAMDANLNSGNSK